MGNDGGSIPKRGDMVKFKAKAESYDKDRVNYEKWNLCALTMEPLVKPVVACRLGRLYNKESVLNFLLDKSRFSEITEAFSHLTSLKDVKELTIKENSSSNGEASRFVCPVTGKEMNGKSKFFYYRGCGCVLSYQAIPEDKTSCVNCSKPVKDEDKIVLNGTTVEVEELKSRLGQDKKKPKKAKEMQNRPVEEAVEYEEEAGPKRKLDAIVSSGEILALKRNKNIDELYSR